MVRELYQDQQRREREMNANIDQQEQPRLLSIRIVADEFNRKRYCLPQAEEVSIVFESTDGTPPANRDIVFYPKSPHMYPYKRINILYPHLDALLLLLPCGEQRWRIELQTTLGSRLTMHKYYKFLLHYRDFIETQPNVL